MFNRRHVVLGLVGWSLTSQAQVSSLSDAINKAGRQRMLSQRMAKSWLAVLMGVDTAQAQLVLDRSMSLFDRQLVELKSYASTDALKQTYQQLDQVWGDFKSTLVGQVPNRNLAARLLELDSAVLKLANQGTGQFEALATKPAGRLVNMAGRQRMLSQRMAKFYYAASLPVQAEQAKTELLAARTEFLSAMQTLKNAPEATNRIKEDIGLAETQWMFFDQALQKIGASATSKAHSDVFVTSENMLSSMDRVTSLYASMQS
jgi:nitrate/nitrite-specific signal transduction histidine kinase